MEQKKPQVGIGVAVLHEGKFLLGKRKGAHGAGQWAFPGGRLHWNETVEACAERELLEETGLRALSTRLGPWTQNVLDADHHFLTAFVFIDQFEGTPQLLEPEKCEGWHWCDPNHLPTPLFPTIQSFFSADPQQKLLQELLSFFQARDWDQFHSPKNLVMDLASEVGELIEPFRWLTEQQSAHLDPKAQQEVRDEIGDVFMTLIYIAHKLGIDPIQASHQKLEKTGRKYPIDQCRGKALKYTAYEQAKI